MTEKQYENLMYALCTIIALGKEKPSPIPGIKYDDVLQMEERKFHEEVKVIYQNLTGSPLNREITHVDLMQKAVREAEEQRKAELAKQAEREEEEKTKQAEQAELERIKNEELAKREAFRVTDTDFLREGATHE